MRRFTFNPQSIASKVVQLFPKSIRRAIKNHIEDIARNAVQVDKLEAEAILNHLESRIDKIMSVSYPQIEGFSSVDGFIDVDEFIGSNYQYFSKHHFDSHYIEWRMRRIRKILEVQGIDFEGVSILELGGGLGDIGAFFAQLGANVVSVEGRSYNSHFANLKYRNLSNFKSIVKDLEKDFSDLGRFDLILSLGSLEVINNIDNYLECCCEMSDSVIFETNVIDSKDPFASGYSTHGKKSSDIPPDLSKDIPDKGYLEKIDYSLSGFVTVPSPFYIERVFSEHGFTMERYFESIINSGPHCYDWEANDLREDITKRRFWRFQKST